MADGDGYCCPSGRCGVTGIEDYRPPKRRRFRDYQRSAWGRQAKHLIGVHGWRVRQPIGAERPWLHCDWCGANRDYGVLTRWRFVVYRALRRRGLRAEERERRRGRWV